MWLCPLCKTPVSLQQASIKCVNNHSFDKAKSGYVNLLPVQFKKSKSPGDDKAMVRARREFHQVNAYKPLKDRLVTLLASQLQSSAANNETLNIYDAGCGEGSYLEALTLGLQQQGFVCSSAGSDISKIAVELAAKAYKSSQFVVASSFDMPLASDSQDVIAQIFAPGSDSEYHRVLKTGGLLVTVDPAHDHLFELKALVYETPKKHDLKLKEKAGFSLVHREILKFDIRFADKEHALSLVKMTPFYWTYPQQQIDNIVKQLTSVTADFHINIWRNLC